MDLSFKEQLAALPIPKLTTVLRVSFTLSENPRVFDQAMRMVEDWWNKKAKPYQTQLLPTTPDLSFSQGEFKAEFARSGEIFSLAMEEPDSSLAGRSWICDFVLKQHRGQTQFAVRVSFRQPQNISNRPEPRAPRFLRDVVDHIGAKDFWDLKSTVQTIAPDDLPFFIDLIESPDRTLPVLTISQDDRTGEIFADTDALARLLAGSAHVVQLDAESSWQLSRNWGKDWSTFQGAIRSYNPGFSRTDDKYKHRLWLPETIQRTDASSRNGFINACTGYIFAQVTAQFESWPLITPSVVRRQVDEVSLQTPPSPSSTSPSIAVSSVGISKVAPSPSVSIPGFPPMLEEKLQKLSETNAELLAKLKRHEESLLALEDALQQERAGRAKSEKDLHEALEHVELYSQEVQTLEEQKRITLGDSAGEQSEALRPLWQNFNVFFNSLHNVASQFRRYEEESKNTHALETKLFEANKQVVDLRATIDSMNRRRPDRNAIQESAFSVDRSTLMEALPGLAQKNPQLKTALTVIATLFPERVTVLETAYASANQSDEFKLGEKAFELLWNLVTEYWAALQDGNGDTDARKVFGNSYAPRESAKLSKPGQARRTFKYQDRLIVMEKHLKIGTADNAAETLRIHFEWIAEEKLIVLGHCGKHLDF